MAFRLTTITYAFLSLVLLSKLGISGEKQQRVLQHSPTISYARMEFARLLKAESQDTSRSSPSAPAL